MEKVEWMVEGMTCSNCALSVNKVLTKAGMNKVQVNPLSGQVQFEAPADHTIVESARKGVEGLGYTIVQEGIPPTAKASNWLGTTLRKGLFCLPFTLLLMAGHIGMSFGWHFLHNPWLQLLVCLPVFVVGMGFFGKSALKSLRSGIPNMNVLIALGATAAFVYSLIGTLTGDPAKIFYETAASIITIVFFGNWLEERTGQKTQEAITRLTRQEKVMATMIAYDGEHNEHLFPVENNALKVGDLVLIKTGEQVPTDCKVLWGEAEVNEAIISGESLPVVKQQNDILLGGSIVVNGTVKAYVHAVGKDTVLNGIVQMMQEAQGQKPPVQQLADRISGVFVPVVIGIALLTLGINYFVAAHTFNESLMRSIAVLVISCPCAMGLATPAAIAVGLGRAAKHGILFTDTKSMEMFQQVKQMVFDKTGTLTNGQFVVVDFACTNIAEDEFKKLVYSLEKFSTHPIATSIAKAWKTTTPLKWKKVEEQKGLGIQATDKEGHVYRIGSANMMGYTNDEAHNIYVDKNGVQLGWLNIADELRPEAAAIIRFCKNRGIKTYLLSGDSRQKCEAVALQLGIDEVLPEQSPVQKLQQIEALVAKAPTVMVGDGVNDAPALARATISISLNKASQLAIKSASVVLLNSGLQKLPMAMQLGRHTYATVKSNLFWAFLYNVVAIPVAAVGLLTPTAGALAMGLSDLVLAANSLWLNWKKVE